MESSAHDQESLSDDDDAQYELIFSDSKLLYEFFTKVSFTPRIDISSGMRISKWANDLSDSVAEQLIVDSCITQILINTNQLQLDVQNETFNFETSTYQQCVNHIKSLFKPDHLRHDMIVQNGNTNNESVISVVVQLREPVVPMRHDSHDDDDNYDTDGIRKVTIKSRQHIRMDFGPNIMDPTLPSTSPCEGLIVTQQASKESNEYITRHLVLNSVILKIDGIDITGMTFDDAIETFEDAMYMLPVDIEYKLPTNVLFAPDFNGGAESNANEETWSMATLLSIYTVQILDIC